MKILVAIYGNPAWTIPANYAEALGERFPELTVAYAPDDAALGREIVDTDIGFLGRLKPELFATARRLRWIHSPAAGVGGLLYPQMVQSPVILTNSRGIHAVGIAEHVIGVTLMLFRRFHTAMRRQFEHRFATDELSAVRTLRGQRIGLVGLGAIGGTIAETAAGLGMQVSATRRNPGRPRPPAVDRLYPPSDLPELLRESDVVVMAAPLTAETRGLIGARELRLMKRDAFLVNVARGKLVKEDELAHELAAGTIAGAALDVFEHEPLDPGSPLWDLPNVIITPHTSGFRGDYWDAVSDLFTENVRRFLRGDPLMNIVDKRAGY